MEKITPGFFLQLRLLLWKNFTIKRRSPIVFLVEVFLPLVLILILLLIRQSQHAYQIPTSHYQSKPLPSAGVIPVLQLFCDTKEDVYEQHNERLQTFLDQVQKIVDDIDRIQAINLKTHLQDLIETGDFQDMNVSSLITDAPQFTKVLNTYGIDHNISTSLLRSSVNISHVFRTVSEYLYGNGSGFDRFMTFAEMFLIATLSNDPVREPASILQSTRIQKEMCANNLISNLFATPIDMESSLNNGLLEQSLCTMDTPTLVQFVNDVSNTVNSTYLLSKLADVQPRLMDNSHKTTESIKSTVRNLKQLSDSFPWQTNVLTSCPALNRLKTDQNSTKEHHHLDHSDKFAGLTRFWKLIEPTLCGQETEVTTHANDNDTTVNNKKDEVKFTEQQMKYFSLVKNILYKNPKILYAPNNSIVQTIIQKANESFMFYDGVTRFAKRWLNMSDNLRSNKFDTSILEQLSLLNQASLHPDISLNSTLDIIDDLACTWLGLVEDINFDVFRGFETETQLEEYFLNRQYHDNVTVIAGLVFENIDEKTKSLPSHVRYKIRQNATLTPPTNLARSRVWAPTPGSNDIKYYDFGFVWIQDMIERTIIDLHVGRDVSEPGNYVKRIPYPCWPWDGFVWKIKHLLPLCLMLSWVYTVSTLVQRIVHEKEKRLKEVMKMMGLSGTVHWCAWTITAILQMTLVVVAITLMLHYGRVLPYSDPYLVFVFLEVFAFSSISFSFLISSFYSKSRLAAACAGIFYFLTYVPYIYISIREDVTNIQIPGPYKFAASIFSTTAFGLGGKYFLYYEIEGIGVQWDNLSVSPEENNEFSLIHIMLMMVIDTALYAVLTWYIENIHPGTYGIPKPWYFPVTPAYWFGQRSNGANCGVKRLFRIKGKSKYSRLNQLDDDPLILNTDIGEWFEEDTSGNPVGVEISGLRKVYSKGSRPAVDCLNLTLYENQITAFLGHNGAGKTTTMSILTGLFPPTSGTASVYGHDICTEMDEVRQNLGMCPQHNVLFDSLTVEEHLWFYSRLKGMQADDIARETDRMLTDLGLSSKRSTMPSCLSGGMQRKLSVAIAFVGGSKTVILDEPTAGVDPYSRRAIWKLLGQYKRGRTILLSTHHMDEADALGDRLAIISNGRLASAGSSLFLKRMFGDGQHIHILKQPADLISVEEDNRNEEIVKDICRIVPKSFVKFDSRNEVIITVPVNPIERYKLAEVCDSLVTNGNRFGIKSFGITDSGLEEIFVKITEETRLDERELKGTNGSPKCTTTKRKIELDDLNLYPLDDTLQDTEEDADLITPLHHVTDQHTSPVNNIFKSNNIQNKRNPFKHFKALFVKRIRHTLRNRKGILSQIILPAIFVSISMTIALAAPKENDPPKMTMSTGQYFNLMKPRGNFVPFYVENSTFENNRRDGSSNKLVNTIQFLLSGLGSDCTLSSQGVKLYETLRKKRQSQLQAVEEFYSPECREVFTGGLNIDVRENASVEFTSTEIIEGARYYPECECKKYSRFECSKGNIFDPPEFTVVTGDNVQDISGLNEEDFYLYSTDKYKLHRYGGLSLGKKLSYVPSRLGYSKTLKNIIKGLIVKEVARVRFDQNGYHAMPIYVNALNNAILRANLPIAKGNPASYGITVINHPMKKTSNFLDTDYINGGTDVLMAIFIIIAMSFVPASFVVFLVHERSIKAKHLQYISGVKPITYWLSNLFWDMFNYIIPAICIIGILLAFRIPAYVGKGNIEAVTALFLVYGWSITPMMYPATFIFKESSVAYISLIILNLFTGITCVVTSFMLQIFDSDENLSASNHILKYVFLVFPNFCLGEGLMDIALNQYKNEFYFHIGQYDKMHSPMAWHITGQKLVAMASTGVAFFLFTILCEYGFFFKCRKQDVFTPRSEDDIDSDVLREKQKVLQGRNDGDLLVLKNLTKFYKTRKRGKICAVNGLNIAVQKGECFGLLGVNGAGKTTTFKMLTGDFTPSSGDATLLNYSLLTKKHLVQQNIGYCPQFDTLFDELTPKEHLQLYARLHGIASDSEIKVVNWALEKLGLVQYSNQTSGTLSGGNKRKLSTAISLVGNPPLLFMDEPTAGMDPYSKKSLWKTIHDLVEDGKSVLFTSHSMEECEILCSRLSIMVNGQLKCLGSIQHLKDKFGEGYTLRMTLKSSRVRIGDVLSKLRSLSQELHLKERGPKMLTFEIKCFHSQLAETYRCLESLVDQNVIEDYSLSQNTLDNVFVNFARQYNVPSNDVTQHQDLEPEDCTTVNVESDYDEPLIELSPRSVLTQDLSDDELVTL